MISRRRLLQSAGAGAALMLPLAGAASPAQGPRYTALALQVACEAVNQDSTREAARARMRRAVERVATQIRATQRFLRAFNGHELKLVVLPEYWMTGFPLGESRQEWQHKAAIGMDGEFSGLLAGLAAGNGVYLCSNHYENDPGFPQLYFQANVVYGPDGATLLRYRRLISLYTPSPWDVWDAYLDRYGAEAIFPVAKTPIGTLGTIASEEILYPEIARMHALNGAEILLHPTSEVGAPGLTPKHIAKRARAVESMAYLVSANTATITGTAIPAASTDAMSKIVDWQGKVMAEAGTGETINANAVIDLDGLRDARRRDGMAHVLSRLPLGAFAGGYQREMAPPNRTPDGRMIEQQQALQLQQQVIERLVRDGVIR
jgi:predicted amidohydrolase